MSEKAPLLPAVRRSRRLFLDSARHQKSSSSPSSPQDEDQDQNRHSIMDCCCLFLSPPAASHDRTKLQHGYVNGAAAEDEEPRLEKEMLYIAKTTEIDLLMDEGASFQDDQWRLHLRDKLLESQESPQAFYHELARSATFDSALEMLTRTYTENGCQKWVPRVQKILDTIQPFTAAITTMVQSNPTVACLVWGSIQLTLATLIRFAAIFDGIGDMLHEISRDLPRFHAYMEVLHTPRLHQALRGVYSIFVEFNFRVVEFLKANKCIIMAKMQWSSVEKEFQTTRKKLTEAKIEFDAEVGLANVQTQRLRHIEMLNKVSTLSTSVNADTVTNVMPSRNPMFEGRINELLTLHSKLEPSFSPKSSERSQCSCVIHGVGGMGKSQMALEYVYRYKSCYSYIFWIRAESNNAITDSFLAAIRLLPIAVDGLSPARQRQAGLEHLQSTSRPWLIVFDNVENASMISEFWPSGRGAIVVTTQNPDLLFMGTASIHLQPMTPAEGSALIQRYLRRGDSEKTAAQSLSEDLGGLPLAITHFAGYISRSQCTIHQISQAYRDRAKSSHLWTAESVASASMYAHTLATVWDLAWRRLSTDSQILLEMIAFLDPDGIPEELFTGVNQTPATSDWQYWDEHRFNEAVAILRERHLVERDLTPTGSNLRTHRVLQRTILHRLDGDVERRTFIFGEVTGMIRKAFPEANIAKRGDLSQLHRCEKYISQVISTHKAFVQSNPRAKGDLTLLTILRDSAYFLMNNGYQVDGISLSETGIEIGKSLLDSHRPQAFYALLDCISCLGVFNEWLGTEGRLRAVHLTSDSLDMLKAHFGRVPPEDLNELEKIRYGRAEHDYGVKIIHFNRTEESDKILDKARYYYSKVEDQAAITSRIANVISFKALISATRQDARTALKLSQESLDMTSAVLGQDNPLYAQGMNGKAMISFTIGDIKQAIVIYEGLLQTRLRLGGKSGHDTLSCQYNLAVCHQNNGSLEKAESLLREILENSCINLQWREEDVARTKFRLGVVLRAMSRPEEAAGWRTQALNARKAWEEQLPEFNRSAEYTDEDDMKLFDDGVVLHHGRTTGIWSDGTHW